MPTTTPTLTEKDLADIEARNRERQQFREHIPAGPYFYDSLGYIHNELGMREAPVPKARMKKPGVLVRSAAWFEALDMDARLTKDDKQIGSDLGQYIALAVDHEIERDMERLIEEVRRLRAIART